MQKYHRDNENAECNAPRNIVAIGCVAYGNIFEYFTGQFEHISIAIVQFSIFTNLMNGSVKIIITIDLDAHFTNAIKIIWEARDSYWSECMEKVH